jgi:hypothetical protein
MPGMATFKKKNIPQLKLKKKSIHFDLQLTLVHNLNHIQNLGWRCFNFFQKKIFCNPLISDISSEIFGFFF